MEVAAGVFGVVVAGAAALPELLLPLDAELPEEPELLLGVEGVLVAVEVTLPCLSTEYPALDLTAFACWLA